MSELLNKILLSGDVDENVALKDLTTLKVGGVARYVAYPRNVFSLQSLIRTCKENGLPFKVLGNGSNVLCSDDEFDGVIIKLNRGFNQSFFNGTELNAQSGCSIIALAYQAMKNGLSGLEFASGIPGTVGGCLFMNAGAYKSSISDLVTEVQVLRNDEIIWLTKEQCEFDYRKSVFQNNPDWIILAVKLQLSIGDKTEINELMKNRQHRRFSTQPLDMPSAGSVFRNPEGGFAWELIDNVGYRGKCYGGACVSEKHSNFIVNMGDAKAKDIDDLINDITAKVKDTFGVDLILEVEKFNWKK